MHPDIGIVRTYRRSDGLYTRPDKQNTLTCQSVDTNDAPRDPLIGPVTTAPATDTLGADTPNASAQYSGSKDSYFPYSLRYRNQYLQNRPQHQKT